MRSKAGISQLNLPHGRKTKKWGKQKIKTDMVRSKQFGEPVESVLKNEGNDLRKRKVLRLE